MAEVSGRNFPDGLAASINCLMSSITGAGLTTVASDSASARRAIVGHPLEEVDDIGGKRFVCIGLGQCCPCSAFQQVELMSGYRIDQRFFCWVIPIYFCFCHPGALGHLRHTCF
jgi:hypothetical protein